MRAFIFAVFISLFCSTTSFSEIKLPQLISDGMVLQRQTTIPVWGWADPGESVTIDFNNQKFSATTDKDGKWFITIPPMEPGGPFTMQLTGSNKITLKDILVGDVWICSGQSNMAQTMERVKDRFPQIIAETNNTQLRYFFVPTTYNFTTPLQDLPPGKWKPATPEHILQFSAIGFFFAKKLFDKYHVPIGLINASVGGSPAEAWLSETALKKFPSHLATANKFKRTNYVDSIRNHENEVRDRWYQNINAQDSGLIHIPRWHDTSIDDKSWKAMNIPGFWDEQGLQNVNGVLWFRKKITIPESAVGKTTRLFLGNIIDQDSVFINGKFIGTTGYQYPPRKYNISPGILKAGENLISIRVINNSGRGGFYKGKPYLIKIENDTIHLDGEWKYKIGKASSPLPPSTTFHYQPGGLFNGMITPLLSTKIKGVIWYQGESNTSRASEYEDLFTSLIHDWREHWQQQFPFLYVQLANYMKETEQPSESNWASLREAQRRTLKVPGTAMVVAIDAGEWNDIHPTDKKTVGERLAVAAEKIAYQEKNTVAMGPIVKSFFRKKDKMIISFDYVGNGLITKNGRELRYFSIAGTDKKFVWAKAIIKKNKVIVWSEQVSNPVAVRYAWADNPEGANLYNREGLPASPFTTEP